MLTVYMNICILIQTKWLSVNRRTHWSSHIYRLIWTCLLYQQCSYSGSTSSLEPRTPHPCSTNQPLTHENILARTVWLEPSCQCPGFQEAEEEVSSPRPGYWFCESKDCVFIAHPLWTPAAVPSTAAPTASMGRFPKPHNKEKQNYVRENVLWKATPSQTCFPLLLPSPFLDGTREAKIQALYFHFLPTHSLSTYTYSSSLSISQTKCSLMSLSLP